MQVLVEFEVVTEYVRDVTQGTRVKIHERFGGTSCIHL
jgi:hypothetical protein